MHKLYILNSVAKSMCSIAILKKSYFFVFVSSCVRTKACQQFKTPSMESKFYFFLFFFIQCFVLSFTLFSPVVTV